MGLRAFVQGRSRRFWLMAGAALVLLALAGYAYGKLDVAALHEATKTLNGPMVFILMTILPLLGFPVGVLHILAGIRWGVGTGLALTIVSIFLQLLASYGLVRLFGSFFARRLEKVRERIPEGAHGSVTVFTLLLPGMPYFAKNYVLPLIGVPLHTYLLWCFPIHAVRSVAGVAFGEFSEELTPGKILAFAAYAAAVGGTCALAFRRLRKQGAFKPRTPPVAPAQGAGV